MIKTCKVCKDEFYTYSSLNSKCPKCVSKVSRKPSKNELEYSKWRKKIALPAVIARDGELCIDCYMAHGYDLHHTKGRLYHKYDIDTLVYLCRVCHQKRHGIKW